VRAAGNCSGPRRAGCKKFLASSASHPTTPPRKPRRGRLPPRQGGRRNRRHSRAASQSYRTGSGRVRSEPEKKCPGTAGGAGRVHRRDPARGRSTPAGSPGR
jgi:hypothetical protein